MTALAAVGAALGAAAAVWLLVAGGGSLRPPVPPESRVVGHPPWRWLGAVPTTLAAVAAGGLLVLLDGTTLALGLVLVGAGAGAWHLVLGVRRRRVAAERAARVVEVCEALAGELRAGQPPQWALRRSVEVWPELDPAATAAELGADVPGALRRLARLPGASDLAELAAAWQVSQASGATLARALGRAADTARRRRATRQLVASELASAQATARLVAVLPVIVLAMGSGLGGDPWGFLLRTPGGLVCLAAGLAFALAGLAWIERISAKAVAP